MPRARSKDPLTAARNSILLPALKPFGFQGQGTRNFFRMCDDVLHTIAPWYSSTGARIFVVEYCAMGLTPPTDFIYITLGGRLCDETTGRELWLPGETHELADASMERVAHLMLRRVLPSFFQQLEKMEDFLALLQQRANPDHHAHFQRACCLVKLQRPDEAKEQLIAATRGYLEDGRSWCYAKAAQCEEMLKAISGGSSLELYQRWKAETIRALRLEKILPSETSA